jgi:quinol-cytochrome oxidoreductase complex cytochrome b subunit
MVNSFNSPLVSFNDGTSDDLHVCRVYLTGGFKRPRELTWVTGVTMAVCTVSFGVTGYSLPWDQVGYCLKL